MARLRAERDESDIVKLYLRGIGQYALLTKLEETRLAKMIEAGRDASSLEASGPDLTSEKRRELRRVVAQGEEAHCAFVQANLRLVVSIAKRYQASGVPLLDLVQEGNLGLIHAVGKFDWNKGFKFSTYATWWIRQAISRGIANTGRTIRLPAHAGDLLMRIHWSRTSLELKLGRRPTLDELATETDLSREKLVEALAWRSEPVSLSEPFGDEVHLHAARSEIEVEPAPLVELDRPPHRRLERGKQFLDLFFARPPGQGGAE